MESATTLSGEHAEDVLGQVLAWMQSDTATALVIITSTEGGAVRAQGALLGVSPSETIGYISGGCIDADVALQARAAIDEGRSRALRYGAGSPFVDLPLPCGGAIDVLIIPAPDRGVLLEAYERLIVRKPVDLIVSPAGNVRVRSASARADKRDYVFSYTPKLRMRIAGRGADALALAKICTAAGYGTRLQLVDEDDIRAAKAAGLQTVEPLTTPASTEDSIDDPWTAFVLLFHDRDWEIPLLKQALAGPAFYIGAVGSKRTHSSRCEALLEAGLAAEDIQRVRGPIGLVPSLRDASMLAVSVLAEIVEAFPGKASSRRKRTAYMMLAAGASSRFEDGDKLLAMLDDKTVLEHAAAQPIEDELVSKYAVVSTSHPGRSELLQGAGWTVIENGDAQSGQSTSLIAALAAIEADQSVDQVIILLGDMPFVPPSHLSAMIQRAEATSISAIMSDADGVLSPPALFKRTHFTALANLSGDTGAKSVFLKIGSGAETLPLSPRQAVDIDQVQDITALEDTLHA